MNTISYETEVALQDLRHRVLSGQPVTAAEYREIIMDISRDRSAASAAASKGNGKKAKATATTKGVDLVALLSQKSGATDGPQ